MKDTISAHIEGGSRLADMKIWTGTQGQYNALSAPDLNTIYLVFP